MGPLGLPWGTFLMYASAIIGCPLITELILRSKWWKKKSITTGHLTRQMMRRNDQKREYDIVFGEEDFMKIGWLQIIMAVIYMGILIGVGLYMSRKVKSSDDFWIGEGR